ncbi:MAG: Rrf2 family transcriptional regulator [Candidatus Omnitrophica bacterium]|nr:Rrf2 family transcriptional regulator [Candidatus Omnitrophota bacterium]
MKITLRGYYAMLALASMAGKGQNGGLVRLEEMTERHSIPENFLLQIFQALKRAGLVRSKRGVHGGFQLTRPPHRITLAEIIESVEGRILPGPLEERPEPTHRPESWRALDGFWEELRERVRGEVDAYTLADLADRIHAPESEMYHI